jgi:outer membrane protein assembly factor BamD (BamD/ComL family)
LHLTTGSIAPLSADEARSDMALVEHRLAPAETSAALPPKPSAVVEHPLAATANSATRLPAPTRSPAERLAAARALRASGQARAAALQYRALQQAHPRSAEAVASLVSLGDIELTELKNPRAALQAFDAYLARGGGQALAEEAHYGRIRALGALGRNSEQLAASERFLERYPNSPHSQALRRKLRTSPR